MPTRRSKVKEMYRRNLILRVSVIAGLLLVGAAIWLAPVLAPKLKAATSAATKFSLKATSKVQELSQSLRQAATAPAAQEVPSIIDMVTAALNKLAGSAAGIGGLVLLYLEIKEKLRALKKKPHPP